MIGISWPNQSAPQSNFLEKVPIEDFVESATSTKGIDELPAPVASEAIATTTIEKGGLQSDDNKKSNCSCVAWARAHSKVGQPPRVDSAKNLLNNRSSPIPGYWVIFGEGLFGKDGHTGIVERFEGTLLTFRGFNYPRCEERVMTIDITDKRYGFKGFFSNQN